MGEILDAFKRAFPEAGRTARYVVVPHDKYLEALRAAGLPPHGAEEMLENMRLLDEFGYYGGESLDETHKLVEDKLTTWDEHMKKAPAFQGLK